MLYTGQVEQFKNALESITLQIEKKAETTAGNLSAYIYLIIDAQLNIQNGKIVSTKYQVTKNVNERTTCCVVRSSNWSRKDAFSIGFTRKRIQKLFRLHYNNLPPTLRYNKTYQLRN